MKSKFIAAALALSSFAMFGSPAVAQEDAYAKGFQAYEQEDYVEAVKWFRLAAEQGDAWAQYNLGGMYAKGQGVPEDFVQAYKWFNLAAAQGEESAILGKEFVREFMNPAQTAEAQKLSSEWKPVGKR